MGPLKDWLLTGAGLALLALAGAAWWGLLAAVGLFALAARRFPGLALVAWVPAALATPVGTVFSLQALLAGAGIALAALSWWPVPKARAFAPLGAGGALLVALLATPLAFTLAGSDLSTGAQAAALAAGGLLGYAWLARTAALNAGASRSA